MEGDKTALKDPLSSMMALLPLLLALLPLTLASPQDMEHNLLWENFKTQADIFTFHTI